LGPQKAALAPNSFNRQSLAFLAILAIPGGTLPPGFIPLHPRVSQFGVGLSRSGWVWDGRSLSLPRLAAGADRFLASCQRPSKYRVSSLGGK